MANFFIRDDFFTNTCGSLFDSRKELRIRTLVRMGQLDQPVFKSCVISCLTACNLVLDGKSVASEESCSFVLPDV